MKILLLPLFVFTVSSAPFNLTDTIISQAPLVNGTTELTVPPVVPVDPRFTYDWIDMDPVPLDQKSLIATATDTMAKLAAMNNNGQIGSFQSPPIPVFSSVIIRFRVIGPAQQVDTRFAVWGVYGLVTNLAIEDAYRSAGLKLLWNSVPIATLTVQKRSTVSSQLTLEQRSDISQNSSDDMPYLQVPTGFPAAGTNKYLGNAAVTNQLTDNNLHAECRYQHDYAVLSTAEVLGALMAGFRIVAAVPKTLRMNGIFKPFADGIDAQVYFGGGEVDLDHPTYQYKYVIETLSAMSQWQLTQQRFGEMLCWMLIDGQLAGIAFLEKLSRPN